MSILMAGAAQIHQASVGQTAGQSPGLCNLTGTIATCSESNIQAGGKTIILTLTGAYTWESTVGADNAITTALIAGIDSAQSEAAGWDAVVKAGLTYANVTRTSATVVTITLPAFSGYAITASETITVTVPATAIDGRGTALVAAPEITVVNVAESIALIGTATASVTADDIAAGGLTLIFTLTGDQFVATLGADNAITTAFIAGLDSGQSEATGWDAVVKTAITHANVTRDSATQVTVTLPAAATYAIGAQETITCTVPATALLARSTAVVASPVFTVTPLTCALSGTITTATEAHIQAGGRTIVLTLTGATWDATVGSDSAATTALIAGIDSNGSETYGWDAVVKAGLTHANVTRTSNTVVTITLPAFSTYVITANETITVTVPAAAVSSTAGMVATPTATVTNVATSVAITGTAASGLTAPQVVSGGREMIFTVTGDQWVATLGADNAITTAFLAGIDSAQSEANGWDAEVKANLIYTMLTRDSATQCTLVLPAAASYAITASETITATIPASALVGSPSAIVASPTVSVSSSDEPVYNAGIHALLDYDDFSAYDSVHIGSSPLSDKYDNAYTGYYQDGVYERYDGVWADNIEEDGIVTLTTGYGDIGNALRILYGGNDGAFEVKVGPISGLTSIGGLDGSLPEVARPYTHLYFTTRFRTSVNANPSSPCSGSVKGFNFYGPSSLRFEFRPTLQTGGGANYYTGTDVRWNWAGGFYMNEPGLHPGATRENWWRNGGAYGEPPSYYGVHNDGNWHTITFEFYTVNHPTHLGSRVWIDGTLVWDNVDNVLCDPAYDIPGTYYRWTEHDIYYWVVWGTFQNGTCSTGCTPFTVDFDEWRAWTDQ